MPFVESDFFLAILKEKDWLKQRALQEYDIHKGDLWTSPSVIMELLLICEEFDLDPENIIAHIYKIVDVRGLEPATALLAAHYIKEKKATSFDAMHAAHAEHDIIISSDSVYDRLGLERIKLEKR